MNYYFEDANLTIFFNLQINMLFLFDLTDTVVRFILTFVDE
jgi:hypothetical protein